MSTWKEDIDQALLDFIIVIKLAGDPVETDEIEVEYLEAPHKAPSRLPAGKMAIYGFWWNGSWLKVGKVGSNSQARYVSQHYNARSVLSTLAGSLINDPQMSTVVLFNPQNCREWIKTSTCRVNILLPSHRKVCFHC